MLVSEDELMAGAVLIGGLIGGAILEGDFKPALPVGDVGVEGGSGGKAV